MKIFSEESALQLSEMLLQNDKDIKIELEEKITSIDVSGEKYDDTELVKRIEDVESSLSNKADKTELHTHTNKEVLDGITNDKITEWDAKATEIFVTNAITQAKLDGSDVDLSGLATIEQLNGKADKTEIPDVSNLVEKEDGKGLFSGSYDDLTDKPSIPEAYDDTDLDNRIKAIEDDYVKQADIPTTLPASDVYDWAKAETKPAYTADEVGALPNTTVIPSIEGLASEEYVNDAIDDDLSELKELLVSSFEELKIALESSDIQGAIAILDEAILNISQLSPDDKATLVGISIIYNGENVPEGTTTSTLNLTVVGEYSDGTSKNIESGYTVSPNFISEGVNVITVSYNNQTSTFEVIGIEVEKTLTSISAVHNDSVAQLYTDAKDLNLTVTGHYSDGTTINITNYSINGTVALGENVFTVEYSGLTCEVIVIGDETADTESADICYVGMIEGEINPKIKTYTIINPGNSGDLYIKSNSGDSGTEGVLGVFGVVSGKTYEIENTVSENYNNYPVLTHIYYLNGTPPKHSNEAYGYELSKVLVEEVPVSNVKGTFTYQFTVPDNTTRCFLRIGGVRSVGDKTRDEIIALFESGLIIREATTGV